ncbi:hypothetical protein SORBI_3008G114700 [Sorghum bicolor]|uniref:Peroxidase n=1 Tax=Sorghum bicolor TaxID=4558 RepID=A0A1Z5R703_SORBI|nr:hypothetical protein SORBI_3008G114700 [Sorghum bicolor]
MSRSCSMTPTSSPPLVVVRLLASAVATMLVLASGGGVCDGAALKAHFYRRSCPAAEAVVRDIVVARVAADPAALPAKLLRLFFHDCFVRGCDASVLLDSTAGNTAEKDAAPNGSLGGFDVIDTAKAVLEAICPGTVSCADIVALAARDAVSLQLGRDLWDVQLGRRDGVVSRASEALADIPSPSDNFTTLEARFGSKGLDVKDLVILSVYKPYQMPSGWTAFADNQALDWVARPLACVLPGPPRAHEIVAQPPNPRRAWSHANSNMLCSGPPSIITRWTHSPTGTVQYKQL